MPMLEFGGISVFSIDSGIPVVEIHSKYFIDPYRNKDEVWLACRMNHNNSVARKLKTEVFFHSNPTES